MALLKPPRQAASLFPVATEGSAPTARWHNSLSAATDPSRTATARWCTTPPRWRRQSWPYGCQRRNGPHGPHGPHEPHGPWASNA